MAAKTKVLIIEDDPGIRRSLALSLKTEGYDVREASNGRVGVAFAGADAPDLIICDVNMPEMDGYAVVTKLRQSPHLASIPFVFLTARGERADVRKGMNLGADDYLTKPFTRDELIETVRVRLKKRDDSREALTQDLILGAERLRSRFLSRLTGDAAQLAVDDAGAADAGTIVEATVLFTDIRGFTTISERLSVAEIATLLNHYFQRACVPIVAAGGRVVKFIGDGIMAVFPHGEGSPREQQALRAIQAGLGLSLLAHEFRDWINARHADRGLPEFSVGVGIHTGEVTLCRLSGAGEDNFTAVGDTVNIAARLEGQTKELGWPVVASGVAISAAGEAVVHGAHRTVHLRGRTKPVLVYEVIGLKGLDAPLGEAQGRLSQQLQVALAGNAKGAATAAKAALRETLLALLSEQAGPSRSAPLRIKNYALVARLVQPGGAALYLAERDSDGRKVAVWVRQNRAGEEASFQVFVQQASILRRLQHASIAQVFDHGFADDVAYIVTEYFPRGSFRQLLSGPLPAPEALALLKQALGAIAQLHALGIVHGALAPENFGRRENGEIVLADLGSPRDGHRYCSPEQMRGARPDRRSDLYALGVILFEMLTGNCPYSAATPDDLKREILQTPIPSLPAALAPWQEILTRLLAKEPAHRPDSAQAVLAALPREDPST